MFNKVILVGNLSRDVEVRYPQANLAISNTAIATSRKFKGQNGEQKEEVMFMDITFFGRSAEVAHQYLRKGSKVLIEGRLVLDQWVDQNGQKRSKHSVAVETMQMLDSKGDNASYAPAPQNQNKSNSNETVEKNDYEQNSRPNTYVSNPEQIPSPIEFDDEEPPF